MPSFEQIKQVFRHIDLNNDASVTREELSVFLRHMLREQAKQYVERLKMLHSKAAGSAENRAASHTPQP